MDSEQKSRLELTNDVKGSIRDPISDVDALRAAGSLLAKLRYKQVYMASDHALLSPQASIREAMAHQLSQKGVIGSRRAQHAPRGAFTASIRHDPLLVLILVTMLADSVSIDVLPGSGVIECELVGGDAHDGAVALVQVAHPVVQTALSGMVDERQPRRAVCERTRIFA